MSPTDTQDKLDFTPPPLPEEEVPVVHGLEHIDVPAQAIGFVPPPEAEEVKSPSGPPATSEETPTLEPPARNLREDPEVQKLLSSHARELNERWERERLQKELTKQRDADEQRLLDLAARVEQGDADAVTELSKHTAAQIQQRQNATQLAAWFQAQTNDAVRHFAGDDVELATKLAVGNFNSLSDWAKAISQHTEDRLRTQYEKQLELASELKSVDKIAQRRQYYPNPDMTEPVAGDTRERRWNSLAEAATLAADNQIPLAEYEMAQKWWREGRLKAGDYGPGA